MNPELLKAIRELVQDLANGRYAEIEADGRAGRLTADELRIAVNDYRRTLSPLPVEAEGLIDVYPRDDQPDLCSVDVTLWTLEEGESDLTLSLTARNDGSKYVLEVSDLHVL